MSKVIEYPKSPQGVGNGSSRHIHSSLMWLVNYFSPDFSQATIMRHCPNQSTCINIYNSHSNLGGRYYYYLFCSKSARGRRQDKMGIVCRVLIRSQTKGRSMFHAKKLKFTLQSVRCYRFFRSVILRVAF